MEESSLKSLKKKKNVAIFLNINFWQSKIYLSQKARNKIWSKQYAPNINLLTKSDSQLNYFGSVRYIIIVIIEVEESALVENNIFFIYSSDKSFFPICPVGFIVKTDLYGKLSYQMLIVTNNIWSSLNLM